MLDQPNRPNVVKETVDPIWVKSKTDKELPIRDIPYTDKLEDSKEGTHQIELPDQFEHYLTPNCEDPATFFQDDLSDDDDDQKSVPAFQNTRLFKKLERYLRDHQFPYKPEQRTCPPPTKNIEGIPYQFGHKIDEAWKLQFENRITQSLSKNLIKPVFHQANFQLCDKEPSTLTQQQQIDSSQSEDESNKNPKKKNFSEELGYDSNLVDNTNNEDEYGDSNDETSTESDNDGIVESEEERLIDPEWSCQLNKIEEAQETATNDVDISEAAVTIKDGVAQLEFRCKTTDTSRTMSFKEYFQYVKDNFAEPSSEGANVRKVSELDKIEEEPVKHPKLNAYQYFTYNPDSLKKAVEGEKSRVEKLSAFLSNSPPLRHGSFPETKLTKKNCAESGVTPRLNLFIKHPVTVKHAFTVKNRPGGISTLLGNKNAVSTILVLPEGKYREQVRIVLTTYPTEQEAILDIYAPADTITNDSFSRNLWLDGLFAVIDSLPEDMLCIIDGDFNVCARSLSKPDGLVSGVNHELEKRIQEHMRRNGFIEVIGKETATCHFPDGSTYIDRFFVRNSICSHGHEFRTRVLETIYIHGKIDHHPVILYRTTPNLLAVAIQGSKFLKRANLENPIAGMRKVIEDHLRDVSENIDQGLGIIPGIISGETKETEMRNINLDSDRMRRFLNQDFVTVNINNLQKALGQLALTDQLEGTRINRLSAFWPFCIACVAGSESEIQFLPEKFVKNIRDSVQLAKEFFETKFYKIFGDHQLHDFAGRSSKDTVKLAKALQLLQKEDFGNLAYSLLGVASVLSGNALSNLTSAMAHCDSIETSAALSWIPLENATPKWELHAEHILSDWGGSYHVYLKKPTALENFQLSQQAPDDCDVVLTRIEWVQIEEDRLKAKPAFAEVPPIEGWISYPNVGYENRMFAFEAFQECCQMLYIISTRNKIINFKSSEIAREMSLKVLAENFSRTKRNFFKSLETKILRSQGSKSKDNDFLCFTITEVKTEKSKETIGVIENIVQQGGDDTKVVKISFKKDEREARLKMLIDGVDLEDEKLAREIGQAIKGNIVYCQGGFLGDLNDDIELDVRDLYFPIVPLIRRVYEAGAKGIVIHFTEAIIRRIVGLFLNSAECLWHWNSFAGTEKWPIESLRNIFPCDSWICSLLGVSFDTFVTKQDFKVAFENSLRDINKHLSEKRVCKNGRNWTNRLKEDENKCQIELLDKSDRLHNEMSKRVAKALLETHCEKIELRKAEQDFPTLSYIDPKEKGKFETLTESEWYELVYTSPIIYRAPQNYLYELPTVNWMTHVLKFDFATAADQLTHGKPGIDLIGILEYGKHQGSRKVFMHMDKRPTKNEDFKEFDAFIAVGKFWMMDPPKFFKGDIIKVNTTRGGFPQGVKDFKSFLDNLGDNNNNPLHILVHCKRTRDRSPAWLAYFVFWVWATSLSAESLTYGCYLFEAAYTKIYHIRNIVRRSFERKLIGIFETKTTMEYDALVRAQLGTASVIDCVLLSNPQLKYLNQGVHLCQHVYLSKWNTAAKTGITQRQGTGLVQQDAAISYSYFEPVLLQVRELVLNVVADGHGILGHEVSATTVLLLKAFLVPLYLSNLVQGTSVAYQVRKDTVEFGGTVLQRQYNTVATEAAALKDIVSKIDKCFELLPRYNKAGTTLSLSLVTRERELGGNVATLLTLGDSPIRFRTSQTEKSICQMPVHTPLYELDVDKEFENKIRQNRGSIKRFKDVENSSKERLLIGTADHLQWLEVTRAIGDWDLKRAIGYPLAEPSILSLDSNWIACAVSTDGIRVFSERFDAALANMGRKSNFQSFHYQIDRELQDPKIKLIDDITILGQIIGGSKERRNDIKNICIKDGFTRDKLVILKTVEEKENQTTNKESIKGKEDNVVFCKPILPTLEPTDDELSVGIGHKIDSKDVYVLHELGAGAFGSVYKVSIGSKAESDDEKLAMKVAIHPKRSKSIWKEASVHIELNKISEHYRHMQQYICMPAAYCKTKCSKIKANNIDRFQLPIGNDIALLYPISLGDANSYFRYRSWIGVNTYEDRSLRFEIVKQMFTAFEYVQKQGIVHVDLKPDNLLLFKQRSNRLSPELSLEDGINVKLGDMGTCMILNQKEMEDGAWVQLARVVCTIVYAPPELMNAEYHKSNANINTRDLDYPGILFACFFSKYYDVWALGLCAVQILTQWRPWAEYGCDNDKPISCKIPPYVPVVIREWYSRVLYRQLNKMLSYDIKSRPLPFETCKILNTIKVPLKYKPIYRGYTQNQNAACNLKAVCHREIDDYFSSDMRTDTGVLNSIPRQVKFQSDVEILEISKYSPIQEDSRNAVEVLSVSRRKFTDKERQQTLSMSAFYKTVRLTNCHIDKANRNFSTLQQQQQQIDSSQSEDESNKNPKKKNFSEELGYTAVNRDHRSAVDEVPPKPKACVESFIRVFNWTTYSDKSDSEDSENEVPSSYPILLDNNAVNDYLKKTDEEYLELNKRSGIREYAATPALYTTRVCKSRYQADNRFACNAPYENENYRIYFDKPYHGYFCVLRKKQLKRMRKRITQKIAKAVEKKLDQREKKKRKFQKNRDEGVHERREEKKLRIQAQKELEQEELNEILEKVKKEQAGWELKNKEKLIASAEPFEGAVGKGFLKRESQKQDPFLAYRDMRTDYMFDVDRAIGDDVPRRYPGRETKQQNFEQNELRKVRIEDTPEGKVKIFDRDSEACPFSDKTIGELLKDYKELVRRYSPSELKKRYPEWDSLESSVIALMDDKALTSGNVQEAMLGIVQLLEGFKETQELNSIKKFRCAQGTIQSCAWILSSFSDSDGTRRPYLAPDTKIVDLMLAFEPIPFTPDRLSSLLGITVYFRPSWGRRDYRFIQAVLQPLCGLKQIAYEKKLFNSAVCLQACLLIREGLKLIQLEPLEISAILRGTRILQIAGDGCGYGTGFYCVTWPRRKLEKLTLSNLEEFTNDIAFHKVDSQVHPTGLRWLACFESETLSLRNALRKCEPDLQFLPRVYTTDHLNLTYMERETPRASLLAFANWVSEIEVALMAPGANLLYMPPNIGDNANRMGHPRIHEAKKEHQISMVCAGERIAQRLQPAIKNYNPGLRIPDNGRRNREMAQSWHLKDLIHEAIAIEKARRAGHPLFKEKTVVIEKEEGNENEEIRSKFLEPLETDVIAPTVGSFQVECDLQSRTNVLDSNLKFDCDEGLDITCEPCENVGRQCFKLNRCKSPHGEFDLYQTCEEEIRADITNEHILKWWASHAILAVNETDDDTLYSNYKRGTAEDVSYMVYSVEKGKLLKQALESIPLIPEKDLDKVIIEILVGGRSQMVGVIQKKEHRLDKFSLRKLHRSGFCLRLSDIQTLLVGTRFVYVLEDLTWAVENCPRCGGLQELMHTFQFYLRELVLPIVECDGTYLGFDDGEPQWRVGRPAEREAKIRFNVSAHRDGLTDVKPGNWSPIRQNFPLTTKWRIEKFLISDSQDWGQLQELLERRIDVERVAEGYPQGCPIVCLRHKVINSLWKSNLGVFKAIQDRREDMACILQEMLNTLKFRNISLDLMLPSAKVLVQVENLADLLVRNLAQENKIQRALRARLFWTAGTLDSIDLSIGAVIIFLNTQGIPTYGYYAGRRNVVCYVDACGFVHYIHVTRLLQKQFEAARNIPVTWVGLHKRPDARLRTLSGRHVVYQISEKLIKDLRIDSVFVQRSCVDSIRLSEHLNKEALEPCVRQIVTVNLLDMGEGGAQFRLGSEDGNERMKSLTCPNLIPGNPTVPPREPPPPNRAKNDVCAIVRESMSNVTHSIWINKFLTTNFVKQEVGNVAAPCFGGVYCGLWKRRPVHFFASHNKPAELWVGNEMSPDDAFMFDVPKDGQLVGTGSHDNTPDFTADGEQYKPLQGAAEGINKALKLSEEGLGAEWDLNYRPPEKFLIETREAGLNRGTVNLDNVYAEFSEKKESGGLWELPREFNNEIDALHYYNDRRIAETEKIEQLATAEYHSLKNTATNADRNWVTPAIRGLATVSRYFQRSEALKILPEYVIEKGKKETPPRKPAYKIPYYEHGTFYENGTKVVMRRSEMKKGLEFTEIGWNVGVWRCTEEPIKNCGWCGDEKESTLLKIVYHDSRDGKRSRGSQMCSCWIEGTVVRIHQVPNNILDKHHFSKADLKTFPRLTAGTYYEPNTLLILEADGLVEGIEFQVVNGKHDENKGPKWRVTGEYSSCKHCDSYGYLLTSIDEKADNSAKTSNTPSFKSVTRCSCFFEKKVVRLLYTPSENDQNHEVSRDFSSGKIEFCEEKQPVRVKPVFKKGYSEQANRQFIEENVISIGIGPGDRSGVDWELVIRLSHIDLNPILL